MGRKRGSRFRKAIDAQEQFEQIDQRQRKSRQGKTGTKIDSIEKSAQREANSRKRIRGRQDLPREFDMD